MAKTALVVFATAIFSFCHAQGIDSTKATGSPAGVSATARPDSANRAETHAVFDSSSLSRKAHPIFVSRGLDSIRILPAPDCDKESLVRSLNTGCNLSTIGNVMYFGGLGVGIVSLISSSDSHSHGPNGLLIGASVVQLAGPILSCIGGDVSSKAMNSNYWRYGNHSGWHDYGSAWTWALLDVGVAILGGAMASSSHNDAIGYATIGAITAIGITADVYMIKSVVGPLVYSSRARGKVE